MNARRLSTLAVLVLALGSTAIAAQDAPVQQSCGTVPSVRATDYRLKSSDSSIQRAVDDVNRNHLTPAVQNMNEGSFGLNVIGDLSFILNHWPNHYSALQALIRYKLAGGNGDRGEYRSAECYFEIAHQFVPQDANVLVLYGIYQYKSGNNDRAELYWKRAIQLDEESAEAYYNLGLLYVEEGRFSEAREHAIHAYNLGYPLPGLKSKLIRAGHWHKEEEN